MRKRIILLLTTLVVMLIMTACGHNCKKDGHIWVGDICETYQICEECNIQGGLVEHAWGTEVCETYQTCEKCGIQGEYISHIWVGDTCEAYQACARCGEQGGEYINHHWVGYTCETYKACEKCGEQGEFIDHYLSARGICTMCGVNKGVELTNENLFDYIGYSIEHVGPTYTDGRGYINYLLKIWRDPESDDAEIEGGSIWLCMDITNYTISFEDVPVYGVNLNINELPSIESELVIPFSTQNNIVYQEGDSWYECSFDEIPASVLESNKYLHPGIFGWDILEMTMRTSGGWAYHKESEFGKIVREKARQEIIDENS